MRKFEISRIESGFNWLQSEFENTVEIQSPDILIQKLDAINSCMAWAGEMMAVAKMELNKAKSKAYKNLAASSYANEKYYAPSLAKDYVSSNCFIEAYNYDLTERFCRTLVHIAENLRTSISALKEQFKLEGYGQRVPY